MKTFLIQIIRIRNIVFNNHYIYYLFSMDLPEQPLFCLRLPKKVESNKVINLISNMKTFLICSVVI